MCIYIHVCTHKRSHRYTQEHTHLRTRTCARTRAKTQMHAYAHKYTHTHTHTYSLSSTHSLSHTHPLSRLLFLTHALSCSLSLARTLCLALNCVSARALRPKGCLLLLSFARSLSFALSRPHTCGHSRGTHTSTLRPLPCFATRDLACSHCSIPRAQIERFMSCVPE